MTKNIKSINEVILPPEYELVRNTNWFDYSIIEKATGNSIKNFEFRGPLSDLFDALCKGNITVPPEVQLRVAPPVIQQQPVAAFTAPVVEVVTRPTPQPIVTVTPTPVPVVKKREEVYISNFDKEPPSEAVLFNTPPKTFNGFFFPDFTNNFINRIRGKRNIFISGESGTGKSDMIQKLADFYGQTVIRINFHQGVTESTLIGKYIVKSGETLFAYGLVPLAMKKGYWLLLDEIDYAEPEHTSVLQAVLEGKPLIITSNEGEMVVPHPSFRIFATGNTTGRGDSSDSYHGTNFMNSAFLDRWTIFQMEYSKKEHKIIENIINDSELSKKMVKIFELFRVLKKNGDITNSVFSTRRMMNIAEALKMGDTLSEAFKYELFSRFNEEENLILTECIRDILDYDWYLSKDWKLGMPHHIPQTTAQQNSSTSSAYEVN